MSTRYVWGRYEKSYVSIAEKESSVLVPNQRGQFVICADGYNLDADKTLYYAILDAPPDPGDAIELSFSTKSFAQIYVGSGQYVVFNDSNSFTFSFNITLYYCSDIQGRFFEVSPYGVSKWEILVYESAIYREKYGRTTEEAKALTSPMSQAPLNPLTPVTACKVRTGIPTRAATTSTRQR